MSDANLRARAILYAEHYFNSVEASIVRPPHPLVAVQELGLSDGQGGTMTGSERRTGRSTPPIRDLDPLARRLDPIMRLIGQTNRFWLAALESYAEHGSVRKAAEAKQVKQSILWKNFDQGIAALQIEMVRERL